MNKIMFTLGTHVQSNDFKIKCDNLKSIFSLDFLHFILKIEN